MFMEASVFLGRRKNLSPSSVPLPRPVMIKLPATQETTESCILARLRYFSWVCDDVQAFASFFFQNTLVEPQEPTVWKGRYGTFALMQYVELQNSAWFQCFELQNLGADKTCTFQGWDFAELYRNGVVKDVNGGEVIKSAF